MFWSISLMSLVTLLTIAIGFYAYMNPLPAGQAGLALRRLKGMLGINVLTFVGGMMAILLLGLQDALAETIPTAGGVKEISMGLGLALIGIGIPTAAATLGAGLAVGPIGAAAMAAVVEKPEAFGRSLIFIGLAEGIAIYGLVVTILLLDKI